VFCGDDWGGVLTSMTPLLFVVEVSCRGVNIGGIGPGCIMPGLRRVLEEELGGCPGQGGSELFDLPVPVPLPGVLAKTSPGGAPGGRASEPAPDGGGMDETIMSLFGNMPLCDVLLPLKPVTLPVVDFIGSSGNANNSPLSPKYCHTHKKIN
jgi:hypothetical protein